MFRHVIKKCCYLQAYRLPSKGSVQIYITPIIRQQQRGAAGSSRDLKPCPPVKSRKKYYYTFGVLLVGAVGVISYAKYDSDFREVLTETVPGTNEVIKFVFQEEKPYMENINDTIAHLKERINQITGNLLGKAGEENTKPAKSDSPKIRPKPDEKIAPSETKKPDEKVTVAKIETEQEKAVKAAAEDLLAAISVVKEAVKDQADSISGLVDKSVRSEDLSIWSQIEEVAEQKQKPVEEAEQKLQSVKANFDKKNKQLPSQNSVKSTLDEVAAALKDLELEKSRLAGALKFAREVEESRDKINKELTTLFPGLKLTEKGSKLSPAEVDLFMLYAYSAITSFQQEIKKLDTVRDAKLRELMARSKANVADLDAKIEKELATEKAKFEEEFKKRKAEIEANCEKDIMEQLKRQTKAHHALLEEALEDKEAEVERRIQGQLEKQFEDEKKKYDTSLMGMVSKMKVLNEAVQTQGSPWAEGLPPSGEDAIDRMKQEKKADQARELWGTCQELSNALKAASGGNTDLKPLKDHIAAITKAAVKGDDFVDSVIASIPRKAMCRGVFSEDMLRDRFERVEKIAKRVAQVPEGGTSLPLIFLAFLQSLFIVQAIEPIPSHELANQPINTATLNNFEILQRARYWMERGDFEQALRYMNLLKGGAKAVAKDWMEETTILLETQQAANVLKAYAIASGLIYL